MGATESQLDTLALISVTKASGTALSLNKYTTAMLTGKIVCIMVLQQNLVAVWQP